MMPEAILDALGAVGGLSSMLSATLSANAGADHFVFEHPRALDMSKTKTKAIKLNSAANEGLAEMFNGMLGSDSIAIAWPRYCRIKQLCINLVRLFRLFHEGPCMRPAVFDVSRREIAEFCARSTAEIEAMFTIDLTAFEWNLSLVDQETLDRFFAQYNEIKKSRLMNTFIILCDRLVCYKAHIGDLTALNHRFIINMPTPTWAPFPFTEFDMKGALLLPGMSPNAITLFLTVLNKAFDLSYHLYNELQSPDIDVDQVAEFIVKNVAELQKIPELHRCKGAFKLICESLDMFKQRFNGYYRDFIHTNKSSVIFEHFILDVSKEKSSTPAVTRQFYKIVQYYRKVTADRTNDPRLKLVFDQIDEAFKKLEQGTTNLVSIREQGDSVAADDVAEEPADSDPLPDPTQKRLEDI